MDPLTQGLLGASCGQALCGRALGRRALVWGALVGMAPDLDVVANASSPLGEWLWHRSFTHSLWFGPVVGPLVGYLLWKWKGGALRAWVTLAVAALLTHPLLDLFTSYGTQLLHPFSSRRFALDAVAIIDPAYSLLLAGGIWIGLGTGLASAASRRAAWAVLLASSLYLLLGLAVNARVETIARRQLEARGTVVARVAAYPTLLQLPYRRVVARAGLVHVGFVSALRPRPIEWLSFAPASGPLIEAARATREARVLEWFAMGEATPRLERASPGGWTVELDDLRYGFPGAPREGLWGLRVRLDEAGRPLGPGERFDRELPAPVPALLRTLWRETLGWS